MSGTGNHIGAATASNQEGFGFYFLYWLRWLAVLPVSLVAAVLASVPVHFVVVSTFRSDSIQLGDDAIRAVEYWGYAFAFPVVFIWVGTWIAPAAKLYVAALLAILWVIFLAAAYIFILAGGVDDAELDPVRAIGSVLLGVVGVAIGSLQTYRKWSEDS